MHCLENICHEIKNWGLFYEILDRHLLSPLLNSCSSLLGLKISPMTSFVLNCSLPAYLFSIPVFLCHGLYWEYQWMTYMYLVMGIYTSHARQPGQKLEFSSLQQVFDGWPWTSHLISMTLRFFICEIKGFN